MKVKDLIEALQACNPEADVIICGQPNYPMEHSLARVTTRRNMDLAIDDEDETKVLRDGESLDDVILAEGSWLRYGSKDAWG